jgi:hypothetical protein
MLPKELSNNHLDFFKNSKHKWVKELYIEFESYFNKYYQPTLDYLNFTEEDEKTLLLASLQNLSLTISYYKDLERKEKSINNPVAVLYWSTNDYKKKELTLDKSKVFLLFVSLTRTWDNFINRILNEKILYWESKEDISKRKEVLNIAFKFGKIGTVKRKQLENVLKNKREEEVKVIDNLISSYISVCDTVIYDKPTISVLQKFSGIDRDIWDYYFSKPTFLIKLMDEINLKIKRVRKKEKKKYWEIISQEVQQRIAKINKRTGL